MGGLTAALASLCLLACDGWTWGEDAPRAARDGSPFAIQVLRTRECAQGATVGAPRGRPSPLLGVEVRITGWHAGGTPVNSYYARLEDGEGNTYEPQDGCEPLLEGAPLAAGQRAQGFVSFPVPTRERSYTLVYEPRLLDGSGQSRKQRVEVPLREPD